MKYQTLFAAAIVAAVIASASSALAQAGAAVAAPAASPSGSADCSVRNNDSGTYGGPVTVVLEKVDDLSRFDLHFHADADAPASVVEAQLPDPVTGLTAFRVSRSYEAVKVYGIGKDGREVLCESELSYTITGRSRPRPVARRAKAAKAAAPAPAPALRDDDPWAVRLGALTVDDGNSRRRLSLAQRRVEDETTLCSGQDADGDGKGDFCETTTATGWTSLADARDVVEGDNRAVERAVGLSRGEAHEIVEQHDQRRHRGAGPGLRTVGSWTGIGTLGGAVACGIASLASGGLAAGICIPALAIGGGAGAVVGVADAL